MSRTVDCLLREVRSLLSQRNSLLQVFNSLFGDSGNFRQNLSNLGAFSPRLLPLEPKKYEIPCIFLL